MARASGLGKGLKALISDLDSQAGEFREVAIDAIVPNPMQPRRYFDETKLAELAQSIKENGMVQPIVVRHMGTRYEIIAGERRWRAAKLAGLSTLPVVVRNMTDAEAMRLALLENLQREDLNPLEEAEAYKTLIEEYGMTQEALADSLGRSRPSISNALRLLGLPVTVREMLEAGSLTMGHARALLGLTDGEAQLVLAKKAANGGLSVRDVEKAVQKAAQGVSRGTRRRRIEAVSPEQLRVEEKLQSALGTKVRVRQAGDGGSGRIEIEFFSREELDRLLEMLLPNGF